MRVSRGLRLFVVTIAAALGSIGAAQAAQASTLHYYGGPVSHSMKVYVVDWGAGVRSTYTDTATGVPGLFSYLAGQSGSTSGIGGVLAQYMDTSGANSQNRISYAGLRTITPPSGSVIQDSQITSTLQSAIGSSALPAPSGDGMSTIYVVLFPPNVNVCEGGSCAYSSGGFCAYHGSVALSSSTHALYAAMVDNGPGTPNFGLCGPSSNDVSNETDVVSHEFSEAVNDPLVAEAPGYSPPLAWYNDAQGEIADICTGSNEAASNGPFTVQKIWSNRDNSCVAGESAFSAPTAAFLANSTAAPGQQVTFNGAGSTDPSSNTASASYLTSNFSIGAGITSYQWHWGDGTPDTTTATPSADHSFSTLGNYEVSLTVTDGLGFTSTVVHQVGITSDGLAVPSASTGNTTALSSSGATLNGSVNPENHAVQYQFLYGTSPTSLTDSTSLTTGPTGSTSTAVSATLSSLVASTTYYYQLAVVAGDQTYLGSVHQFTTSAAAPPPPPTPVVTTGAAGAITTSGAVLSGTVNPNTATSSATYRFLYGTSPASLTGGTSQHTLSPGTTAVPVSATLGGLSAGKTYYYELVVTLASKTYTGTVQSFNTPFPLPSVGTASVSAITAAGATVNGSVNPRGSATTYWVEFGPTSQYGFSTVATAVGGGTSFIQVKVPLAGLNPNTVYHYRLDATNAGGTSVGSDHSFRTALAAAPHAALSFHVTRASVHQALTNGLTVHYNCGGSCTADFTVTLVPHGPLLQAGVVPITVAHVTVPSSGGVATATIPFSSEEQARLSTMHSMQVIVSASVSSSGTAPSPTVTQRVSLG